MKIVIKNKSVLLIMISILSLSLIGCSRRSDPQSMEADNMQDNSPGVSVTDIPEDGNSVTESGSHAVPTTEQGVSDTVTKEPDESIISEPSKDDSHIKISFASTSETVYATANVKVRSSCTTEEDNTVSILQKGKSIIRTGFNKEWSRVAYQGKDCYIKSTYLSTEKPSVTTVPVNVNIPTVTQAPADTRDDTSGSNTSKDDFVTKLKLPSDVNQLVCVIGKGTSDCTVTFHVKNDAGQWSQQFSTSGNCGSRGITYHKKEGDGKTPAGLYSFTMAFGLKPDPGASILYRQITEYDYWIDDLMSPFYNTWVNSLDTPGDYTSEHLIDHSPQYNYALNINYNPDCTPGLGSAIFLHGFNGLGHTTGCIAVSEKYVKTLVENLKSTAMILIVPGSDALKNYE